MKVIINSKKKFYQSKMMWVTTLGFLTFLVQGFTGFIISPETQGVGLMLILSVLRLVTKDEIVWK